MRTGKYADAPRSTARAGGRSIQEPTRFYGVTTSAEQPPRCFGHVSRLVQGDVANPSAAHLTASATDMVDEDPRSAAALLHSQVEALAIGVQPRLKNGDQISRQRRSHPPHARPGV